ncbi:MAG: MBL fold metallo-hydrolase [Spirochaetes bacterium]|nr:MBL fold metallo-hydrolase [Spirochaetota bacterium]
MKIKFLGVRGSLPTPLTNNEYHQRLREVITLALQKKIQIENIETFIESLPLNLRTVFGGNTTCVVVTSESGKSYVIDCGTGIRPLGDELIKGDCGQGKGEIHIFITHTHWDHIQGLPFFKPLYIKGNILNFYSPYIDLEERLIAQQRDSRFFPAPFEKTLSTKKFILLKPESPIVFDDGLTVDCYPLKHPDGSYAYRFKQNGKIFIFATDVEFTGEVFEKVGSETDFFLNADLLVIDSQYTLDESFFKFDWGHTAYTAAVNCGIRWHVKKLVLTHHEPSYSDEKLATIYTEALEHREAMKTQTPELFMAVEGLVFTL